MGRCSQGCRAYEEIRCDILFRCYRGRGWHLGRGRKERPQRLHQPVYSQSDGQGLISCLFRFRSLGVILCEFCVCAALSANWCSLSTLKRKADTSQLFAMLLKLVYFDCFLASQLFPACNDNIAIMWVELHQERIAV